METNEILGYVLAIAVIIIGFCGTIDAIKQIKRNK
jgi:flagellar motor component MotA